MNLTTYTIEGNSFQTTKLDHVLTRAKEVANKVKQLAIVLKDGKPFCKVAKNGKLIIN